VTTAATTAGSSAEGRPSSLTDLVAALNALPGMLPVDRARQIPALIEAAKSVLACERAAAMVAATAPGGITRAELARELGVSRSKVTEAIAAHATATMPGRRGAAPG
jgi:hypothetical protein